jgi:hypothetical protein
MPTSLPRVVESFAFLALCAVLVPSPVYSQSLREQVIGTWTLVSWTRFVGASRNRFRSAGTPSAR